MKKFNIALTFNNQVASSIINYSQKINKKIDSDVTLGLDSNPHMTIGQFTIEEDKVDKLWKEYSSIIKELPKITLSGITVLPSSSGGAWIEISILKSQELLNLQEKLIKTLKPFCKLTNDIGDKYRPHITIAHLTTGNKISNFIFDYDPLRLKNVETKLGLGLGTDFLEL